MGGADAGTHGWWVLYQPIFATIDAWKNYCKTWAPQMEAYGLAVDPQLTGTPSTQGTCWTGGAPTGPQTCAAASPYKLRTTSPLIGAGADVGTLLNLDPGTRDYCGNAIPHNIGSGYNIGAYGGVGQ